MSTQSNQIAHFRLSVRLFYYLDLLCFCINNIHEEGGAPSYVYVMLTVCSDQSSDKNHKETAGMTI